MYNLIELISNVVSVHIRLPINGQKLQWVIFDNTFSYISTYLLKKLKKMGKNWITQLVFGLQSESMAQLLWKCWKQCFILQKSHQIYNRIDRMASNWRPIKGTVRLWRKQLFQLTQLIIYYHSEKDARDEKKTYKQKLTHKFPNIPEQKWW